MARATPPIYFYLSQLCWVPVNIQAALSNAEIPINIFSYGPCCWTLQTYLHLKAAGFPCQFVRKLPKQGIVLAHRDCLPNRLKPGRELLLVCLQADRKQAHPYAQLHIVQNLEQTKRIENSHFIHHWIQPGLIPRNLARGNRFENIAFFGTPENLAPELSTPTWQEQIAALGLNWQVVHRDRWHDYSQVDAILAVRDFTGKTYPTKPATKLQNAWHTGVPAILGNESAFRAERKSELDYLEVNSVEDLLTALRRLRDDQVLRQAIVNNGWQRAQETQTEQLVNDWCQLLTQIVVPAYEQWCSISESAQFAFLAQRSIAAPKESRWQDMLQELKKVKQWLKTVYLPEIQRSLQIQLNHLRKLIPIGTKVKRNI